jgi:Uma2 family endonuclease
VDEYLHSSYSPDMEYVDGILVERNVGTIPHSFLQKLLLLHFARFERDLGFVALPECRTKVSSSCYRVPDVLVVSEPVDFAARFYAGVPLAVIEVLSPEDKMKITLQRFKDYQALGVPFIVQMDPEAAITHVFEANNLICKELDALNLPDLPIPFNTRELYERLGVR